VIGGAVPSRASLHRNAIMERRAPCIGEAGCVPVAADHPLCRAVAVFKAADDVFVAAAANLD